MPYINPDTNRITIHVAGLPDLVCDRGPGSDLWQRAQVGGAVSDGKTRMGQTKLKQDGFKPYYVWTGSLLLDQTAIAILERINALFENNRVDAWLSDEFERVDEIKSTWHQRQMIPASLIEIAPGINQCYCRFPVILQFDSGAERMGAGFYKIQFQAEELL